MNTPYFLLCLSFFTFSRNLRSSFLLLLGASSCESSKRPLLGGFLCSWSLLSPFFPMLRFVNNEASTCSKYDPLCYSLVRLVLCSKLTTSTTIVCEKMCFNLTQACIEYITINNFFASKVYRDMCLVFFIFSYLENDEVN